MSTKDFDLMDKGDEVMKAAAALADETKGLAELNDEPRLRQDDVEGFIAAVIRIVASLLNH